MAADALRLRTSRRSPSMPSALAFVRRVCSHVRLSSGFDSASRYNPHHHADLVAWRLGASTMPVIATVAEASVGFSTSCRSSSSCCDCSVAYHSIPPDGASKPRK